MKQISEIKENIAVVVENTQLQDYIALILIGEGYRVQTYACESDFKRNSTSSRYDLLIVDYSSAKVDGLGVCRLMRNNILLRQTPILMLLPEKSPIDKAKAIYSGADDYIDKSTLAQDLLFRVKTTLWRIYKSQDRHPLTKLPGLPATLKELSIRMEQNQNFAVAYADLFKLRRFNDRYGFKKGNQVILHTAQLLLRGLLELGDQSDFLSHVGGDDFMFITLSEGIDEVCKKIVADFDASIPSFYDKEDRERKCIYVKNRQGELIHYPFLKISIGVLTTKDYPLRSTAQIMQVTTELKDYAKVFDKSLYVRERRKTYPFS